MKPVPILLFIMLWFAGCGDTITIQEPIEGSLVGIIRAYEKYHYISAEGARVTIENTDPQIVVLAGADGRFTIEGLKTGSYNITFSKEGFGTYKIPGYAFVGGDSPARLSTTLFRLPEVHIEAIEVTVQNIFDHNTLMGVITIDPPNQTFFAIDVRYYISTSPDVSYNDYLSTGTLSISFSGAQGQLYGDIDVSQYSAGTDLYMVMYPCAENNQNYVDVDTGTMIYTSITTEPSPVVHFKTL